MKNQLTPKEERIIEMTIRIAELIKAAKTTDEIELAAFLVKNGVYDNNEIHKIATKEAAKWSAIYSAIWND